MYAKSFEKLTFLTPWYANRCVREPMTPKYAPLHLFLTHLPLLHCTKIKFSIKDFLRECGEENFLFTFTEKILNEKLLENFIFLKVLSLLNTWENQRFSDIFKENRTRTFVGNRFTISLAICPADLFKHGKCIYHWTVYLCHQPCETFTR